MAGEIAVNSEAFENLCELCDRFGSRFFATEEEKKAAEFLAYKFQQYGLENARAEPYSHWGWQDGKLTELWSWRRDTALLELLQPEARPLHCISLANAPSTEDTGVTAEIFNLQSASRSYLLDHREEIKGKLVLSLDLRDPPNLYRPTVYGYLEEFGAAGYLWSNRNYGNLPKTGSARFGAIGEIPACAIARETYDFIRREMNKGKVTAKVKVKNTYAPGATSYNVIADLPGSKYPDEIVLVGGHYDGHDISVGALDDAAGACVVLEAARALAKHAGKLKRTIRFCCFASEEMGLNGATGYVLNHANEVKNIQLMINTDTSGISSKTGHGFVVWEPKELASYLDRVLDGLGSFDRNHELPSLKAINFDEGQSGWPFNRVPYSDQWPFYMVGVPVAYFKDIPADPIDSLYSHTTADTVDKVDPKGLKDAATILALTLMRVSDEDEIPFKQIPIERVVKIMEEGGVAEDMRKEKRWRREARV